MNDRSWLRELLESVLIGLVVFVAIQFALVNFRVAGSSMRPTLMDGHYLIVGKVEYYQLDTGRLGHILPFWMPNEPQRLHVVRPPSRGDVIVFDYPRDPDRQFVKRIIGEPGETVGIDDGEVTINGQPLREPYLDVLGSADMQPVRLRLDEYFVLGDNRTGSQDSRHWGPLNEDHIIGKVWAIYWPQSAWGFPK
jgi:signal peptidase I